MYYLIDKYAPFPEGHDPQNLTSRKRPRYPRREITPRINIPVKLGVMGCHVKVWQWEIEEILPKHMVTLILVRSDLNLSSFNFTKWEVETCHQVIALSQINPTMRSVQLGQGSPGETGRQWPPVQFNLILL